MKKKNLLVYTLGIAIFIIALFLLFRQNETPASPNIEKLALCLKEKNVTMYGAYWCPHCQNQKKLFGSAFKDVPYVECTEDTTKCREMNIQNYPTWILEDGKRLVGEIPLDTLAKESSCQY